jgi:uncharacterized protein YbjQ (UPF0145 family)
MSYPILTTNQYDPSKYAPVGSVLINQVEAISLFRSIFGGITSAFGGAQPIIQEAIDRLQARGLEALTQKIQMTYPNTVMVNSLRTDISNVEGTNDSGSYIIMTMTATCYVPVDMMRGGKRKNRASKIALRNTRRR